MSVRLERQVFARCVQQLPLLHVHLNLDLLGRLGSFLSLFLDNDPADPDNRLERDVEQLEGGRRRRSELDELELSAGRGEQRVKAEFAVGLSACASRERVSDRLCGRGEKETNRWTITQPPRMTSSPSRSAVTCSKV